MIHVFVLILGFSWQAQAVEIFASELPAISVNANTEQTSISQFESELIRGLGSVRKIGYDELQEKQILSLKDLKKIEASISDSYNASGYYDYLSMRGMVLDQTGNLYRNSLPISGSTKVILDNKEQIQFSKGAHAQQMAASVPGGMVNLITKKPQADSFSRWSLMGQSFARQNHIDFKQSLDSNFVLNSTQRLRLNLANNQLPSGYTKDSKKEAMIAMAHQWQITDKFVLDSEFEYSESAQASQPGWSLYGNALPDPVSPSLNINSQPWSQPVVFKNFTASIAGHHQLPDNQKIDWSFGRQNLVNNDRLAYPFGCSSENNYDRYCSDGTFDLYDYRSENEQRIFNAAQMGWQKTFSTNEVNQTLGLQINASEYKEDFGLQANNSVGIGKWDGSLVVAPNSTESDAATLRQQKLSAIYLRHSIELANWRINYGANISTIHRQSQKTDGSRKVDYHQSLVTPSLGAGFMLDQHEYFGQYTQSVESYVVPNKSSYTLRGQVLPAARTHQLEIGLRSRAGKSGLIQPFSFAAFAYRRPQVSDVSPTYELDGFIEANGLEVTKSWQSQRWDIHIAGMMLDAKIKNSKLQSPLNNKRPVNTPSNSFRSELSYLLDLEKDVSVSLAYLRESEKVVLPDNSMKIPAWERFDLRSTFGMLKVYRQPVQLQMSIENLLNKRFWRESPYQYGHVYLFPAAARSVAISMSGAF